MKQNDYSGERVALFTGSASSFPYYRVALELRAGSTGYLTYDSGSYDPEPAKNGYVFVLVGF